MRQALDPSLLEEAMKENEDSDSGNVHEKKKRKLGLCDDVKRKQNKQDEEENTAKDQKKEEHMKVRERACAARTPMQELTKKTGDTPIIAAKTNIEQREGWDQRQAIWYRKRHHQRIQQSFARNVHITTQASETGA